MLFSQNNTLNLTPKLASTLKPSSFWITQNSHLFALGTTINPNWIVWDGIDDSIRETHNSYYAIKEYEKKFDMHSTEMYEGWKKGRLSGPDYSNWVSEYMMVWDKIRANT